MNQLHIVQSIGTNFGGLGLAALRYAQAVALAGAKVQLYVIDRRSDELPIDFTNGHVTIIGSSCSTLPERLIHLKRYLTNHKFDVVHIHGTWTLMLAFASYICFFNSIPIVVSPHGCLELWALNHRKWKKFLAMALYQRNIFNKASMLIATAKQELDSIRSIGIKTPVAVLPLGIDIPVKQVSEHSAIRNFLFLSRIHPKKGLVDLVRAWAKVRRPGWKIIIAGGADDGHFDEIQQLVITFDLQDDFEFTGLVVGEYKDKLFYEADVFVLPTYSENFGIAIAEALAHGVPVITTTGAPWENIVTWECGWWVQPGVDSIASALESAMDTPKTKLVEMGERGVRLLQANYSWIQIGHSANAAYEWVLGLTKLRPNFVDISEEYL